MCPMLNQILLLGYSSLVFVILIDNLAFCIEHKSLCSVLQVCTDYRVLYLAVSASHNLD